MSEENELKATPQGQNEEQHAQGEQAQRDEEIAAIQQHSKHQAPGIQKPPDLPPASAGKALIMVALVLLILLLAGGFTLWDLESHNRVRAKETERDTVPTVSIFYPQT